MFVVCFFFLGGLSYGIAVINCQNAKAKREGFCFFFCFFLFVCFSWSIHILKFWECSEYKLLQYSSIHVLKRGVDVVDFFFPVVLFGFVNDKLQME